MRALPRNVLVIDDDSSVLESLTDGLSHLGINTVGLLRADDGLRKMRHGPQPDCIVLDWALPELSGRDFLKALRQDAQLQRIPVLVISGVPDLGEVGADAVLAKPFGLDDLVGALRRACRVP
jgi:two-component system OmpR family response regulator